MNNCIPYFMWMWLLIHPRTQRWVSWTSNEGACGAGQVSYYSDVACQTTSNSTVCSTACSLKESTNALHYRSFVRGIHRSPKKANNTESVPTAWRLHVKSGLSMDTSLVSDRYQFTRNKMMIRLWVHIGNARIAAFNSWCDLVSVAVMV